MNKEIVIEWLEQQAQFQINKERQKLHQRLSILEKISLKEYVREGLGGLCPSDAPEEVLKYLDVSDKDMHFSVQSDCGNEGLRLQINQGNWEWDRIEDPWGAEPQNQESWDKAKMGTCMDCGDDLLEPREYCSNCEDREWNECIKCGEIIPVSDEYCLDCW